ncbi:unnamed protein product [Lactuca saligna]|uniref:Uncharacterized protein n=1 Tax=Lactuca saligna TaxID=75948 RepID=A0AA35Y8L1_LACSI|nr:unnamed protein product [Lactuca saligna]
MQTLILNLVVQPPPSEIPATTPVRTPNHRSCLSVFVAAMEALIRHREHNNHSGTAIRVQLRYRWPIASLLPPPCVTAATLPSSSEPPYPRSSSSIADVVDILAMDCHHC